MIESHRFRLYPTREQEVLLAKHFGSVRFVYNWALDYSTRQYAQSKKHLGWMGIASSNDFRQLKVDNPWLYEVGATTLQNTIAHLDKAYQRFFKHQGGFPRYKSKYDNRQSFEVPSGLKLDFRHGKIQIPKFLNRKNEDNRLKCVFSKKVRKGRIGTATISKNACGQYFISFIVHTQEVERPTVPDSGITSDNSIGIDFGLKHFLTFDNGTKIDSPEYFRQSLDKLAREQRKLSKKQKGSRNREKQRLKVARCHNHISNQRENFLHNLTTQLADENQVKAICMEDLNLKGIMKRWGRKVSDLSYYTFTTMLEYKLKRRGKRLLKIGRFQPSTQICSNCGHRRHMNLDDRTYVCPECGMAMDRDVNAAKNIKSFALRDILKISNTDATSGINACGVGGSGSNGASRLNETVDVEAGKCEGPDSLNLNGLQPLSS